MFRVVYTAYTWMVAVPLVLLSTVFFGLLCLSTAPFIGPRRAGRLCGVPWARFGLFITGSSVNVSGRENMDPQQSYVIVANHLSLYDIWVLYGYLDVDFRWVAKQELRQVPIVGTACVALGHVFIDRSNTERAKASLAHAKTQLVRGTSILFFPEGTRSRDGDLRPFKRGAFHMAVEMQLPVLPVVIIGTREILPPDGLWQTPGQADILIQPPLPVRGSGDPEVERLMSDSRQAISNTLEAAGHVGIIQQG